MVARAADGGCAVMLAWRCWAFRWEPGVLSSFLDPFRDRHNRVVEWRPGCDWQPAAECAFHSHFAPDDSPLCGRCGWRGERDLAELIWWLSDFKRVVPPAVGLVELGGRILAGDPKHPEIPGIRRAERIRLAGPVVIAPGYGEHVSAFAGMYGVQARLSSARHLDRSWVKNIPADLGLDFSVFPRHRPGRAGSWPGRP